MQKWEYATIPLIIHNTKAILDTWVVPGPNEQNLVAYLKRAKD